MAEETNPTPETTAEETQPLTEETTEAQGEETAEEHAQNPTKAIDGLNQKFGTMTKRVDDMMGVLERLTSKIESQGGNPTPKQEAQIEQAADELAAMYAKERDEMDNLSVLEGRILDKKLKRVEKMLADSREEGARQITGLEDQMHRSEFRREHPDLYDQYDSLVEQGRKALEDIPKDERRGAAWQRLVDQTWDGLVSDATEGKTGKDGEARTNTTRKVPGARTVTSSAASPTQSPEKGEREMAGLSANLARALNSAV